MDIEKARKIANLTERELGLMIGYLGGPNARTKIDFSGVLEEARRIVEREDLDREAKEALPRSRRRI